MTRARLAIARVLEGLPAELAALIRERVRFVERPRPSAKDLQLGIGAGWRGAFLGEQWTGPGSRARGTILLYTDHMRDDDELVEVVLHELHHFLGADEDDVDAEGLGEHAGLAEREAFACG